MPLALQLSRLVALTMVLIAAASYGALPLFAAALGVFLARPLILWRAGFAS